MIRPGKPRRVFVRRASGRCIPPSALCRPRERWICLSGIVPLQVARNHSLFYPEGEVGVRRDLCLWRCGGGARKLSTRADPMKSVLARGLPSLARGSGEPPVPDAPSQGIWVCGGPFSACCSIPFADRPRPRAGRRSVWIQLVVPSAS
jgi:hypothetical protein